MLQIIHAVQLQDFTVFLIYIEPFC